MKKFITGWLINTLAVLVAVYIVPGLKFSDHSLTPFIAALLLGILNAFIRPVLMFFALPLLIFTLGLFTLIINAFLLELVSLLMGSYFEVESFKYAFLGALVISIVSTLLNILTGNTQSKARLERQRRNPPRRGEPDGKGPVIDV